MSRSPSEMASRAPQLLVAVVCAVATMEVEATSVLPSATSALIEFWELVGPGGRLHPAKFLEYGGHIIVETILLSIIVYFLLQRSFKPSQKSREPLTEREIQSLCDEWQPEPLHPTLTEEERNLTPVVIDRVMGSEVQIGDRWVLSMASYDFLSLADSSSSKEVADNTICKYGVGSCGPRGFYGTIDVHLQLEERLAEFMGTEEAIMYSYDLATLPSVLPAFASKKDVLVCDEAVNYAIRNGCHLSKATVLFFKHNDPQDLERILQRYIAAEQNARKPLNRRFIVVEGIYTNYGDVAPLREIWEIKQRYKFRLVVDESLALGALGRNGRGACEHWQLPESDVEIRTASLGNAIASVRSSCSHPPGLRCWVGLPWHPELASEVGGFCAGSRNIVEHQRLSGNGYVFSASLPPFLATVAMNNLQQLSQESHDGIPRLQHLAQRLRTLLKGASIRGLALHGTKQDGVSPLLHLHLKAPHSELPLPQQLALLQRVADHALEHHDVLLAVNRMTHYDQRSAPPSLKLIVTVAHSEEQLQIAASAVRQAADAVLCS